MADTAFDLQQQANHEVIRQNSTCDASYKYEMKKFIAWVREQPHLATQVPPFTTRRNVDEYFSHVIPTRIGNNNTIRRVVNSLNHLAHKVEHIGANPAFECDSAVVASAITAQKAYQKKHSGNAHLGTDPHKGLKDILPLSDLVRMMAYIFRSRSDWGPASVNLSLGMNACIRGDSIRSFVYADLRLSHGFGPERDGPLSRALLCVLRRGEVHKDRHEMDEQVCVWRHKHYLVCSVVSTAAYLLYSLSNNPTIDFYHLEKDERAGWWDTAFIHWQTYSGK
jgi:hypothetical protein